MSHPQKGAAVLNALLSFALIFTAGYGVYEIIPADTAAQQASATLALGETDLASAADVATPSLETRAGSSRCDSSKSQSAAESDAQADDLNAVCVPGCTYDVYQQSASAEYATKVVALDTCPQINGQATLSCARTARCVVRYCIGSSPCVEAGSKSLAGGSPEQYLKQKLGMSTDTGPITLKESPDLQKVLDLAKTNPAAAQEMLSGMSQPLQAAYKELQGEAVQQNKTEIQNNIEAIKELGASNPAAQQEYQNKISALQEENQKLAQVNPGLVTSQGVLAAPGQDYPELGPIAGSEGRDSMPEFARGQDTFADAELAHRATETQHVSPSFAGECPDCVSGERAWPDANWRPLYAAAGDQREAAFQEVNAEPQEWPTSVWKPESSQENAAFEELNRGGGSTLLEERNQEGVAARAPGSLSDTELDRLAELSLRRQAAAQAENAGDLVPLNQAESYEWRNLIQRYGEFGLIEHDERPRTPDEDSRYAEYVAKLQRGEMLTREETVDMMRLDDRRRSLGDVDGRNGVAPLSTTEVEEYAGFQQKRARGEAYFTREEIEQYRDLRTRYAFAGTSDELVSGTPRTSEEAAELKEIFNKRPSDRTVGEWVRALNDEAADDSFVRQFNNPYKVEPNTNSPITGSITAEELPVLPGEVREGLGAVPQAAAEGASPAERDYVEKLNGGWAFDTFAAGAKGPEFEEANWPEDIERLSDGSCLQDTEEELGYNSAVPCPLPTRTTYGAVWRPDQTFLSGNESEAPRGDEPNANTSRAGTVANTAPELTGELTPLDEAEKLRYAELVRDSWQPGYDYESEENKEVQKLAARYGAFGLERASTEPLSVEEQARLDELENKDKASKTVAEWAQLMDLKAKQGYALRDQDTLNEMLPDPEDFPITDAERVALGAKPDTGLTGAQNAATLNDGDLRRLAELQNMHARENAPGSDYRMSNEEFRERADLLERFRSQGVNSEWKRLTEDEEKRYVELQDKDAKSGLTLAEREEALKLEARYRQYALSTPTSPTPSAAEGLGYIPQSAAPGASLVEQGYIEALKGGWVFDVTTGDGSYALEGFRVKQQSPALEESLSDTTSQERIDDCARHRDCTGDAPRAVWTPQHQLTEFASGPQSTTQAIDDTNPPGDQSSSAMPRGIVTSTSDCGVAADENGKCPPAQPANISKQDKDYGPGTETLPSKKDKDYGPGTESASAPTPRPDGTAPKQGIEENSGYCLATAGSSSERLWLVNRGYQCDATGQGSYSCTMQKGAAGCAPSFNPTPSTPAAPQAPQKSGTAPAPTTRSAGASQGSGAAQQQQTGTPQGSGAPQPQQPYTPSNAQLQQAIPQQGTVLSGDYFCVTSKDPLIVMPLSAGQAMPANCYNAEYQRAQNAANAGATQAQNSPLTQKPMWDTQTGLPCTNEFANKIVCGTVQSVPLPWQKPAATPGVTAQNLQNYPGWQPGAAAPVSQTGGMCYASIYNGDQFTYAIARGYTCQYGMYPTVCSKPDLGAPSSCTSP